MVLTRKEKTEYTKLKKITKNTPVKVKRVGPANVQIYGEGFGKVTKQLGGNVGTSATTVVKARISVLKKRGLKKLRSKKYRGYY